MQNVTNRPRYKTSKRSVLPAAEKSAGGWEERGEYKMRKKIEKEVNYLLLDDEISPWEAAFMLGYEE